MNQIFEKLYPSGTELEITGKTPFFLNDPETVWCVIEGQVNVYVTAREGENQTGSRDHLFTVYKDQAIFGVEAGFLGSAMGLLASGTPGTRVLKITRAELLNLSEDEDIKGIADLAELFLEGLGGGIVKDIVPLPRIRQKITTDTVELEPDRAAGTDNLLWVKLQEGSVLFTGTESITPETGFFAVPSNCWVIPLGKCLIRGHRTEELVRSGEIGAALNLFCETAFSSLAMNARLRAADDLGNLRQMQRSRSQALKSGLKTLACALSENGEKVDHKQSDTPLRHAFQAIAASLGMGLPSLPEDKEGESLHDMARAFNLRVRNVTLAGPWWLSDGASLIAYRDETPVALIPTGRGRYHMVDQTGEYSVTQEIASSLAPEAFHLYRPLPGRALKGLDLLSFGLQGSRKDLTFAFIIAIGMALLGIIPPKVNGIIFSEVIPGAERGRIIQLFAILISVALSTGLMRFAQGVAFLRSETALDYDVSVGLWDRILRLPVAFFQKNTAGDLANRALGLYMLRNVASMAVKTLLIQTVFVVFYVGQVLWYDWRLALTGLACMTMQGLIMIVVNVLQLKFQRAMTTLQNSLSSLTFQILTGIAKLRVAGAEERSFSRWARIFGRQRRLSTQARALENGLNTATAFFSVVTTMAILYALIRWSVDEGGSYDTGRFMSFWTAFTSLQTAFLMVISSATSTLNILPLAENLAPILETEPETGELKVDPGDITGRIEMDHVTYRYYSDGPPVLKNLSFHAEPGEFVAVVGPSGAGKSTLIRLLLGFDQPESGSVFFDNKDMSDLDLKKLRGQIGVVLQGGGLLPGDIASNVRCSRPLSMDQVKEALKMAGMEEDLASMPMGVHTVITEGANTISGGQRQRLLIARAIAGKPKILIFDEATSALDNRTQDLVSKSLEDIEATRIVVAHRLSTVIGADRILVLDSGTLAEEGTYDELMSKNGLFAGLIQRQIV